MPTVTSRRAPAKEAIVEERRRPIYFAPQKSYHWITSSAMASSVGGTVMPSVRAVCRLMTNSNRVGCMTGISAGFSPLSMRPT